MKRVASRAILYAASARGGFLCTTAAGTCPSALSKWFCSCGEFSYLRNYVLHHQYIAHYHTDQTFVVDGITFMEFRNLILPHVGGPNTRAALALGFLACHPLREEDPEEPVAVSQPAAT